MQTEELIDQLVTLRQMADRRRAELRKSIEDLERNLRMAEQSVKKIHATVLSFSTPSGPLTVTFQPPLTPGQYEQAYALMEADLSTPHDVLEVLTEVTEQWGVEFKMLC